jgi:membrane-associated PAP2 superfamily phosphatase
MIPLAHGGAMSPLACFLSGLIAMGFAVAGLFFLSFWRRTRDSLFLAFAVAFGLLAVNQGLTTFVRAPEETQSQIYLIRLMAFLILIVAIVLKNTARPKDRG